MIRLTDEELAVLTLERKEEKRKYNKIMRDLDFGSPEEKVLAKDELASSPKWSFIYAYFVRHAPWPPGELAIAKDAYYSLYYTMNVLGSRFKHCEETIAASPYKAAYDSFIRLSSNLRRRHVRLSQWSSQEA